MGVSPLSDREHRHIVVGSPDYLPAGVREQLEALGMGVDDLEPGVSGIRTGLGRDDLPGVVAAILEYVDGDVELEIGPGETGYAVEWHRVREDDWGSWGEFRPASERGDAR